MLVRYLPGLGISEIRYLFFRGLIWIRLRNSGIFCVGQVPGTSHVATTPEKHTCERRIRPSLSRPFPASPASSLFVDCQKRPWCDTYQVGNCGNFLPLFFCSLCRLVLQKKKYQVLEEIILFAAACCCCCYCCGCCCIFTISFFLTLLSPPKCTHQGHTVIVLCQRSGAAYCLK